ncbi:hypothetical protein ABK040_008282 [Willaertia magna]
MDTVNNKFERIGVIYNPISRSGQGKQLFSDFIQPLLEKYFGEKVKQILATKSSGDGSRCAFELVVKHNCDLIISCGGDGHNFHCLNGLIRGCLFLNKDCLNNSNDNDSGGEPLPVTFATLPIGSGNDFYKGLGINVDMAYKEEMYSFLMKMLAVDGKVIEIDIGSVTYQKDITSGLIPDVINRELIPEEYNVLDTATTTTAVGEDNNNKAYLLDSETKGTRFFLNVSTLGIGPEVLVAVNNSSISKELNYNFQSLWKQLTYNNPHMEIEINGEKKIDEICELVAVSNGCFIGNGMKVTPNAKIVDGTFDLCALGNLRIWDFPRVFSKLFSGTHTDDHQVKMLNNATNVKISSKSEQGVYVECDGEVIGKTPCEYKMLKGKLRYVVPSFSKQYKAYLEHKSNECKVIL